MTDTSNFEEKIIHNMLDLHVRISELAADVAGLRPFISMAAAFLSVVLAAGGWLAYQSYNTSRNVGELSVTLEHLDVANVALRDSLEDLSTTVSAFARLPTPTVGGPSSAGPAQSQAVAELRTEVSAITKKVDLFAGALDSNPERFISVALLRKDLESVSGQLRSVEQDIIKTDERTSEELGRVYTLVVTTLGTIITLGAGVIGFFVADFLRQRRLTESTAVEARYKRDREVEDLERGS